MCHFEEKWITQNSARPTIWFRYVDDVFTLFKTEDSAKQFLNDCHNHIKFIIEFEENGQIPFLDILLKRIDQHNFSTSVYRKETFTGLCTKWETFNPRKYKINIIRTLSFRCCRICSSPLSLQSLLNTITSALADHAISTGHSLKWDHFEILVTGRSDHHSTTKKLFLFVIFSHP